MREAHNPYSWKGSGIGLGAKGDQMKRPRRPTPGPILFRSELLASSFPAGRDDCPNRPCSMLKFKAVNAGARKRTIPSLGKYLA